MITTIKSDSLRVGIEDFGAELAFITSAASGREFLWKGDPSIWNGRSPILFPVVGRLIDDRLKLTEGTYHLPKHGFAMNSLFSLVESGESHAVFRLTDSDETYQCYPFRFVLDAQFCAQRRTLAVTYRVCNRDERPMPFSIGGHPAFRCEIGDRLVFSERETALAQKLNHNAYLETAEEVFHGSNELVITKNIFDNDALIFEGLRSDSVTLESPAYRIKVDLGGCPYLGIWAKPGAPYVCIEPWFGIDDHVGDDTDFYHKKGVITLAPEETFTDTYRIDILED